ncbi:MAG: hypothetical protein ABIQ06_11240 [Caldimonas sp.]
MDSLNRRHSPQEFAALLDAAKVRAAAARAEAIDAFFLAAIAAVRRQARRRGTASGRLPTGHLRATATATSNR